MIIKNLSITTVATVITETKMIFYILLGILFYFVSDLLRTEDGSGALAYIIIFALFISYISNYILTKYYNGPSAYEILISFGISIGTYLIALLFIYLIKNKSYFENSKEIFNNAYDKNYGYSLFFFFLLIIYTLILKFYSLDSFKNKIMQPAVLGIFLIIFIFSFIIFICRNIGLINRNQYLDTFLVLITMLIACIYIYIYFFLGSLSSVCEIPKGEAKKEEADNKNVKFISEETTVSTLLLLSIFLLLWIDDSKVWYQKEYLIFIFVSFMVFASLFFYSTKFPSTGILSLWLLIEWIITWYKNGGNAKNSVHYVALKK